MKENMEYFFEGLEELKATVPELYARYSHNNLLIEQINYGENKRWLVTYVKKDGDMEREYVSLNDGVYPVLKLIANALLDTMAENREALKHTETGQNITGEYILRQTILRFITRNFMLQKYEELNTEGRDTVKQLMSDVKKLKESSLQKVKTKEAKQIVSILDMDDSKEYIITWKLKQKTTGGIEYITAENSIVTKTDLFIVVSYCHEMLRMLRKKMKRFNENDDFYKDAIFLIEKIENFEATL